MQPIGLLLKIKWIFLILKSLFKYNNLNHDIRDFLKDKIQINITLNKYKLNETAKNNNYFYLYHHTLFLNYEITNLYKNNYIIKD